MIRWQMPREALIIGPLTIYWYSLCFALGFLGAYWIVARAYRREGQAVARLDALLFKIVLGTVVGARLGHVLFYDPGYYLSQPLEIFKTWHGGLASHGGLLGIVVAVYFHCRNRPREPLLWVLDRLSLGAGFAAALIRVGNFFNSEIVGRPTDLPWGVVFVAVDDRPRHPAMLYEALAYLATLALMLALYRRLPSMRRPGRLTGLLLALVFGARLAIEFIKEDQSPFEAGMLLNMGQVLSLPVILVGFYLLLRRLSREAGD